MAKEEITLIDLHERVTALEKTVGTLMEDFRSRRGPTSEPKPLTEHKLTGYLCRICGKPQYETPSGAVCENGHGGADSV